MLFYSTTALTMDEVYKLLKIRNTFKIEDFVTIAEVTSKKYKVLPLLTLKRSFQAASKVPNDVVDNWLKKSQTWEQVVLFSDLKEIELRKSDVDSIRFIRSKKNFEQGQYQKAIKEIRSMNKSSEVYNRSLYLLGLMFLYNNQYSAAHDAFNGCIRLTSKLLEDSNLLRTQMNLFIKDKCQIADSRVSFKEKKFDEAKEAYKKIPLESYEWPESLIELAWIFYLDKSYPKSFARNLTLENKAFSKFMYVENRLLAVMNLKRNCYHKQALDLATKTVDEYNLVLKDLSNYTSLEESNVWKVFEKDILETPFVVLRRKIISEIDMDLKNLVKLPETAIKDTFSSELQEARQKIVDDMNSYVKRLLKRKYLSISRNIEDLLAVKLSIINELKLNEKAKKKAKKKDVKKIDNRVKWKFNNEYWPDELEDISINLTSKCV